MKYRVRIMTPRGSFLSGDFPEDQVEKLSEIVRGPSSYVQFTLADGRELVIQGECAKRSAFVIEESTVED